ncbi:MAG: AAA family ATPase [Alphaproteobacteria bacterium]|nr:AAA family ATPase [Alphaproteobacteria bacterium]
MTEDAAHREGITIGTGGAGTPFPVVRDVDLGTAPAAVGWLVKGWLTADGLSVVYAEPKAGKSFLALDLALHIACGRAWQGRKVLTGGIIYVAAEASRTFRNRVIAARQAGLDPGAHRLSIVQAAPQLLNAEGWPDLPKLLESIDHERAAMGSPLRLVVIDTLARSIVGDENSASDMGAYVQAADILRKRTGAHLTLVHHVPKAGGEWPRGSDALRGAADTLIRVEKGKDGEPNRATITAARDGEEGLEMAFRLERVTIGEDEDGEPVTTCIVRHEERAARRETARARLTANEMGWFKDIVDYFAAHAVEPVFVDPDHPSPVTAVTRADLYPWLAARGRLVLEPVTNGSRAAASVPGAARNTMYKMTKALDDKGYLKCNAEWIWLVPKLESDTSPTSPSRHPSVTRDARLASPMSPPPFKGG